MYLLDTNVVSELLHQTWVVSRPAKLFLFKQFQSHSVTGNLSGLRQFVEETVHGAEYIGFVGIEDVVICVGQTDHLS